MPATSKKQEKFMQAVAHNKAFAKKVGVPQKVGKEFTMKKYAKGGVPMESKMMKKEGRGMAKADMQAHSDIKKDKPMMQKVAAKAVKGHETRMHGAKKMAKGGLAAGHKQADGVASKGKTKGTMVAMRKGRMCK